jgi:acetyl-CoA carboxylase carboxyltransferase component
LQSEVSFPILSRREKTYVGMSSSTPIIFLHNVTGFMVGLKTERAGLIKKGAQFVSAVSNSRVPHISVIIGASYGAGNYAMCGRAYEPRFLFTWPTGRCSVMGPDQLSGVMEMITRNSAKREGKELNEAKMSAKTAEFRNGVQRDSESYMTSAHLLDDGVIEPEDTRDVLGMCLEVVNVNPVEGAACFQVLARL